MQRWYEQLPASAQAAFANLVPAAQTLSLNRTVADLPGGFTHKKLGKMTYWYYQFKSLDGKTRQIYLGNDSESLRGLITAFKAQPSHTEALAHLGRLCRSAIELGANAIGRTHYPDTAEIG